MDLSKEEYQKILKKLNKIIIKNNELNQLNEYLISSINSNIEVNDQTLNSEDTKYIKEKIVTINNSIQNKLIIKIEEKLSS